MLLSKKIYDNVIRCAFKSTNVKESKYNMVHKQLTILFMNGYIYKYWGVPFLVYKKLELALSTGKYFHKNIRFTYTYKQIEKPKK